MLAHLHAFDAADALPAILLSALCCIVTSAALLKAQASIGSSDQYLAAATATAPMSGRAQILSLYRRILFAAARFPSKNRANVYAEIRDEFRRNATLAEPEAGEAVALARQSLRQLEAYTTMTRSSGNWEITMEKNPMPKPPSADASSSGGGAAGAS